MPQTLLTNEETYLSAGMVGSIVTGVSLILYHYFFTRNNINFLTNDVKQLKSGLSDISDTLYNMVNEKIKILEDKHSVKLESIKSNINEHNEYINEILKEIRDNESSYKSIIKKETKQMNDLIFVKIDELRNKTTDNEHKLTKLETNVDIMLKESNNDNIDMIMNNIANLKELNNIRFNNLDRISKIHRDTIDTINNNILNFFKDK